MRKATGPCANYCQDEIDDDRKLDNGIAIIVRAGLLALIKPYIREGESNGMEHDERQGEVSAKERGNGRVGGGRYWHGVEEQDRVREERAGGTRCCLLNPRDQYDVPYLFLPRNIANDGVRDTRTCSCFPIYVTRGEVMLRQLIPDFSRKVFVVLYFSST